MLSFSSSYFNTRFKNQTIFLKLSGDIGQNLDREEQFLLGGDTGLRGYPVRFLDGSRQLLFTLEDRIFTNVELFHLFNIGMAVFFDAGAVWNDQEEFGTSAFRKDVGVGLRIGQRRSALSNVVHIDLAYPLDKVEGKRKLQFLVMTSETF
ncbi:MAG: BamA/TamA family outer membrane protein [Acidobacteriota bacterium]